MPGDAAPRDNSSSGDACKELPSPVPMGTAAWDWSAAPDPPIPTPTAASQRDSIAAEGLNDPRLQGSLGLGAHVRMRCCAGCQRDGASAAPRVGATAHLEAGQKATALQRGRQGAGRAGQRRGAPTQCWTHSPSDRGKREKRKGQEQGGEGRSCSLSTSHLSTFLQAPRCCRRVLAQAYYIYL